MSLSLGLVSRGWTYQTSRTYTQEGLPNKKPNRRTAEHRPCAGSVELCGTQTFEDIFLKKSFFMGESNLDPALMSLLHLIDDPRTKILSFQGLDYLIDQRHLDLKIRQSPNKTVKCRFREWKVDKKGFYKKKYPTILHFCSAFGIPLDTINGIYPMKFSNFRVVSHALKLSWAIFLTLKMFKLRGDLQFRQRVRKGDFKVLDQNLLAKLFIHNYHKLKDCEDEKSVIKLLKNSLCTMVSLAMDQDELPEGDWYNYFPEEIFNQIQKKLSTDTFVRLTFSCLQSKVLCQEVPEEFVLDALIKHRNQLSSPHRGLSTETLRCLTERGRKFGKLVRKYYKPNKGFFPSNKATFQFPRNMGGVKGDLVYNNRFGNSVVEDPDDRMEPFVVGLFGQPGMGKSSRINELISYFRTFFPSLPNSQLVYQRTCHVDHWDGYNGQPIVIFDDLGQATDGSDIKEFQTLVSCCPYVLPMADLSEKGQKFQSPIIIATSNLKYGMPLMHVYKDTPIIDDASFWRRFHVPLLVEFRELYSLRTEPSWIRQENCLLKSRLSDKFKLSVTADKFFQRKPDFDQHGDSCNWEPFTDLRVLKDIFRLRKAYHENIRNTWTQKVIEEDTNSNVDKLKDLLNQSGINESTGFPLPEPKPVNQCLNFPAYPPSHPLPVRVEPIKEPLKVRTITAGKGDTFCLKPLQRAMWLALNDEPQFCLTHGTNRLESAIQRIHGQSNVDDVWISGDYSAATDSFSIEGSKALLEGILESIDHEPTKRWALKEISPHLLVYPKRFDLEPVLQESGQLMGSLLSFPLLCLLNDCTASFAGVSPEKYLINGDDILMRAPAEVYPLWKEKVRNFGLDLSAGKNYIHPRYGTVNSQLVIDGSIVGSGKQKVLDRRSEVLGECLRDLELMMPETDSNEVHDLFKSVNRSKLSRTVRDIDVPMSHGGLSFSWGDLDKKSKRTHRTIKLCYLHDLFEKINPQKDCISIPYLSKQEKVISELEQRMDCFLEPVTSKEFHEDFLRVVHLERVTKRCHTHPHLRDILLEQDIKHLPSLSFLHSLQIPCSDAKIRKLLQKQIDELFLSNFLQGGIGFDYSEYRKLVLLKTMNCHENCQSTIKSIFDFCDLSIPRDFLCHLNLQFDPRVMVKEDFERTLFKGSTNQSLQPMLFDLPENHDYLDFSRDYLEDQELHECLRAFDSFLFEKDSELFPVYSQAWIPIEDRQDLQ
jgi:hypothetical protein